MVDWTAVNKAFSNLPRNKQISCSKLTHGWINTNAQNNKHYGLSDLCPCCKSKKETMAHIFNCRDEAAVTNRQLEQASMFATHMKMKTPPQIITCIKHGLTKWETLGHESEQMTAPNRGSVRLLDVALTQAFRDQTRHIGWGHFLRGWISIHCGKAFAICSKSPDTQNKEIVWRAHLITAV